MRARVTRRLLESEAARADGWIYDTEARGYVARYQQRAGSRWHYMVAYAIGGRRRYHVIGADGDSTGRPDPTAWTPESARREAIRIRGLLAIGQDPDASRAIPTLRVFAERYMQEHAIPFKRPRSAAGDRGMLDRHLLPDLGDLRLDQIDTARVTRFAHARRDTGVTANRALALLSHMYTKAGEWGLVPTSTNPVRGVPRFRERHIERFLSHEELGRLGQAMRELETEGRQHPDHAVSPFALAALRLLLLTGMRPSEVLVLTWPDVDLANGVLRLPDSKTGRKVVHLNPPSAELLANLPRLANDPRVFPPRRRGAMEADLESAWRRVRRRARLDGVRLYDARHTFASVGVMSGASLYLVGSLLGHAKTTTTARYAHFGAGPLEALSATVGKQIADALAGRRREDE
jgi:integrase